MRQHGAAAEEIVDDDGHMIVQVRKQGRQALKVRFSVLNAKLQKRGQAGSAKTDRRRSFGSSFQKTVTA